MRVHDVLVAAPAILIVYGVEIIVVGATVIVVHLPHVLARASLAAAVVVARVAFVMLKVVGSHLDGARVGPIGVVGATDALRVVRHVEVGARV